MNPVRQESHNNTPQASPRKRRASPLGFVHDANARNDQKILALRAEGGWEYYGLYWATIEMLRESSDHCLAYEYVGAIAVSHGLLLDRFNAFIDCCLRIGLLKSDDKIIFSESLNDRIEAYESVVAEKRKAGKASAAARLNRRSTDVPDSPNMCSTDVEEKVTDVQHPQSNIIEPNLIESNITEPNEGGEGGSAPPEPPKPVDPPDPRIARVESKLAKVTGNEPWEKSNDFINAGRRPMIDYPLLKISAPELAHVVDIFTEQLPGGNWVPLFLQAQAEIQCQIAKGVKEHHLSAFKYLTTFCLETGLKLKNERVKIEKNSQRNGQNG